jgi:hypothetical protein
LPVEISVDEALGAIESLVERGHVRMLTNADMSAIDTMVVGDHSDPGRLVERPTVGNLEVWVSGAPVIRALQSLAYGQDELTERRATSVAREGLKEFDVYATEVDLLNEFLDSAAFNASQLKIGTIVPIGPWRPRWWLRHPSGVSAYCALS